ncbi:MAG TPA: 1-(5-phosphoribosyl)-5-[(5-phosphoribosylamino)methylideneamino] imidazole-4-carboxamide isomerase [Kofleriaceae bacterium]|jgi:phosphoribosylformimino-5-aminoimidazole carboxamide ribotide isomerase|nr:1-(5-phosphoribosyl)-5-[(5-phosphoribosylamino)methylideneamino] imidazole-4-carboxamide isomerase [Kofleriaceae bacterium]
MKLYPAIDLLGGNAVRLEAGRRDRATIFSERPVELVAALARGGADRLHVVDLDGAFAGAPQQTALIRELVAGSPIPVEVGGGIRDRAAIDAALELGAAFVVLGTAAVAAPALVEAACRDHPGKLIVAVDAKDGIVAVEGWTKTGDITAVELGACAASWGAAALLYTDVARDGLHVGPNIAATVELARACNCEVIASGGVGSLDDLARLRDAGIAAVIVGRALYDKRFTIEAACEVAHAR